MLYNFLNLRLRPRMFIMAAISMTGTFTKDYFDNGLQSGLSSYEGYLSGGYHPTQVGPKAAAIAEAALLKTGDKLLDFGCAAGYYVYYYREKLGLEAFGVDVSKDAVDCAPEGMCQYLFLRQNKDITSFESNEFDLVVAKDVLEHMPASELDMIIAELLRIGKKLIISVPVSQYDGGPFIDPTDEQDPSHVIRLTRESWMQKLGSTVVPLEEVCVALKGQARCSSNLTALVVK